MASQRISKIIAGIACFFLLLTTAKVLHSRRFVLQSALANAPSASLSAQPPSKAHSGTTSTIKDDKCLQYLRKPQLKLTPQVKYQRRCIKPNYGDHDRNAVHQKSHPLITHGKTVDLDPQLCPTSGHLTSSCQPIALDVTNIYPQKQYPHLVFGIASKYERVEKALPAFAHWLAGTGAHLVGVIADAADEGNTLNLTKLTEQYASAGVWVTFKAPDMKMLKDVKNLDKEGKDLGIPIEQHHHMLVKDLLDVATNETKWLAVLDDDTFFPDLFPLDKELAKYDHDKSTWLGGLTEDFDKVKQWGFQAFGGAGTFLSLPLARQVEPHLVKCIVEKHEPTGDAMLKECVWKYSSTRLTIMPGLYQLDLLHETSGFFESGRQPLSIHHWQSWFHEPIPVQAAVTKVCGSCYLQRWRFGKDTQFTNGYSIVQYADGLGSVPLDVTEMTWSEPKDAYEYSLGPLRPKLDESKKKSFRLQDSDMLVDGAFRQIYVHYHKEDTHDLDEVVELMWEGIQ